MREYILRKLLARRGYLFRPTSHAAILALSFAILFLGGAGGNIILGRGVAQGPDYLPEEDDTLEHVIITRTAVPEGRANDGVIAYTVKEGDTLSEIGEKFRVSTESIRYANSLSDVHSLKIGQDLTIPPISGVIATVTADDTVESLAQKFSVSPQAIVDFNYLQEPFILEVGQEIVIPDADIPTPQPTAPTPSGQQSNLATGPAQPGVSGTGNFIWPSDHRYVTQYFTGYHPAIDIAKFSALYAADGGTVIEAATSGWNWGYGKYVKIDHGNGYTTMYAHMSELHVSVGSVVGRGQTIGLMGNTGRSFGTHVHFVVQYNGQYINPLSVL